MSQSDLLLNQVRQFAKELLFADYALAESTVAKQSQLLIGDRAKEDEIRDHRAQRANTLVPKRPTAGRSGSG